VAEAFNNLALLYLAQHDWRAVDYWRRSTGVAVRRAMRGTDSATPKSQHNHAFALHRLNSYNLTKVIDLSQGQRKSLYSATGQLTSDHCAIGRERFRRKKREEQAMDRRNFIASVGATAAMTAIGSHRTQAAASERKWLSAVRASLHTGPQLAVDEKQLIADLSAKLVQEIYAHRVMKMTLYGIDIVPQLRALRLRAQDMKDVAFHREMRRMFAQLHDRHTHYMSGEATTKYTLPVHTMRALDNGVAKYFVTKSDDKGVPIRSEITHWNGVPPDRVVEELAEDIGAGNLSSRLALARRYLTSRLTSMFDAPAEDWVRLTIVDQSGNTTDVQLNWLLEPVARKLVIPSDHRPDVGIDEPLFLTSEQETAFGVSGKTITVSGRDYGLLRIETFKNPDNVDVSDTAYVDEVVKVIKDLPKTGLLIDLRHNGGGIISHGESLLQLFTANPIEPHGFRFRASASIEAIAKANHRFSKWLPTISQGLAVGSEYSADFPITSKRAANRVGRVYSGPSVLIVDAVTYSTADMFTSGFQYHGIGKIVGVDDNIGAGGANNWKYSDLRAYLPDDPRFPALPNGVEIGFALRQAIRKGPFEGMILEDEGVRFDARYELTKDDLFEHNKDLLVFACGLLAG
jgi:C-terminal processing protease CtpA/Prc